MTFKQEPLGKYVNVIGGFAFKSEHFSKEGVPIVRISDIQDGAVSVEKVARIPEASIGKGERYAIEPGDILVAMSGATTGKIGLVPQNFSGLILQNQRVGNFKITSPEKIHKVYLRHFVCSDAYQRQILNSMAGAAQPNISSKQLENIEIPIPPLHEQDRIATILDQADLLRAKRREALAQLASLSQSIFLEMFGDPLPMRSRWPTSFLAEVCEKISDGTHHSPPIQTIGIPYITAKHLKEYGLDFEAAPWFISPKDHRRIFARCDPRFGDVLYIKDGVTTGIAAVNRYHFEFSMLSSLALLRPASGVLDAQFLCCWLNDPIVKNEILGAMAGAAIRRLTLTKIKQISIPIPPLDQQQLFATRVNSIRHLKSVETKALAELDSLFSSLQHRAFRGEL